MVKCQHKNGTTPGWTYSTCNDCGAVLTDHGWGVASRKWFRNLAEAKFYAAHGRYSDGEELAQLRAELTDAEWRLSIALEQAKNATAELTALKAAAKPIVDWWQREKTVANPPYLPGHIVLGTDGQEAVGVEELDELARLCGEG